MINKITTILYSLWDKYLKYRYIDPVLSFSKYCIGIGAGFFTTGSAWFLLVTIRVWNIPAEFAFGPDKPIVLGGLLIFSGLFLGIWRILKTTSKQSCVLIDHRGMPGMDVADPIKSLPTKYRIGHVPRIVLHSDDFEYGKTISPDKLLKKILSLKFQLDNFVKGREFDSIKIAYAGLAPIPLLVTAGYIVKDRQECLTMDYDRSSSSWHILDFPDDNEKYIVERSVNDDSQELAVIAPLTVEISKVSVENTVGEIPQIWVELENGARMDSLKSENKQNRILIEIYNLFANLRKDYPKLNRVHLFLATQASFAFRIGQSINPSVHPPIIVYQYDSMNNKYAWGVSLQPGHEPSIVFTD